MLHSLLMNADCDVVVHYLHGSNFPTTDAARLEQMLGASANRLELHEVPDDWLKGLPTQNRFGPAMWYRLFLPELLPSVRKLLYLDVDTLITDQLAPLWKVDLGDRYLGAVTNVFIEGHAYRHEQLGIDPSHYFNSGVLVLNLNVMRNERFTEQVIRTIVDMLEVLEWPDQDALNLVVADRRVRLHPRWNCMNSLLTRRHLAINVFGAQTVDEAVLRPAIRHFEGPDQNKPWHLLHDRRGQRLYRVHRSASPWPEYGMEGTTWLNRCKRVLADVRNPSAVLNRPSVTERER